MTMKMRSFLIVLPVLFTSVSEASSALCFEFYSKASKSPVTETAEAIFKRHLEEGKPIVALLSDVSIRKLIMDKAKGNPNFQGELKLELNRLQRNRLELEADLKSESEGQLEAQQLKLEEPVRENNPYDFVNKRLPTHPLRKFDFRPESTTINPGFSVSDVTALTELGFFVRLPSMGEHLVGSYHRENHHGKFSLKTNRPGTTNTNPIDLDFRQRRVVSWVMDKDFNQRIVFYTDFLTPNSMPLQHTVMSQVSLNYYEFRDRPNQGTIRRVKSVGNGNVVVGFGDGAIRVYSKDKQSGLDKFSDRLFPRAYNPKDSGAIGEVKYIQELINGDLITVHNGYTEGDFSLFNRTHQGYVQYWNLNVDGTYSAAQSLTLPVKNISGFKELSSGKFALSSHDGNVHIIGWKDGNKLFIEDKIPLLKENGTLAVPLGMIAVYGHDLILSGRDGLFHLGPNESGKYEISSREVKPQGIDVNDMIFLTEISTNEFITYGGTGSGGNLRHWNVQIK